jgi:hypothetical protein
MKIFMRKKCLDLARLYVRAFKIKAQWRDTDAPAAWANVHEVVCRRPTSPWRLAILLHEIGHVVNGAITPVWFDDYLAWMWARAQLMRLKMWTQEIDANARDSMAQTVLNSAANKGWDNQVPAWLYRCVRLNPNKVAKAYAKRRKPVPPTWEECPCSACEKAKKRKR